SDLKKQLKDGSKSGKLVQVIVQYARLGVDSDTLARGRKGRVRRKYGWFRGAALGLPRSEVEKLSQDPNVAWVSPDRPVRAQWDQDAESVGADQVWVNPGWKGGGIRVAVLDTGVYAGSADWNAYGTTSSRLFGWKDFVNNQPAPYDDNGHGTHV